MYAEPIGYWKSYYNVFDMGVLVFSVSHLIVTALNLDQEGYIAVKVIRGNHTLLVTYCLRSFMLALFSVLRSLCILRLVSFSRGLQVLVTAFVHTLVNALFHLLLLLLIFMFIFAIMGYYFFGYEENGDTRNWGDFGIAMLSLFNYVTVSVLLIFLRDAWC